jgi:N-acetylmuramoyl-L-alanine amidase
LIPLRKYAVVLLAALASASTSAVFVRAQTQTASSIKVGAPAGWSINHSMIVLDPAHGGTEGGAMLGDHAEKDITSAIASKLRVALSANGFTVMSTRDAGGPDLLPVDQRAEIANHTHAVACIVLHATATGSGVHLYTSDLQPPNQDPDLTAEFVPIPWDSAQSGFVRQSADLAANLSTALGKAHLPATLGHAPIRPLNNLMCPAVAIELSPLRAPGREATSATDADYQQQVANALAGALRAWRDSPSLLPAADATAGGQTTARSKAIAAAEATGRAAAKVRAPATSTGSPPAQKGPQ